MAVGQYEEAEAPYLSALADGRPSEELAALADAIRVAADEWQRVAYKAFFSLRDQFGDCDRTVIELEIDAERAEMLQDLWRDIRDAHRRLRQT